MPYELSTPYAVHLQSPIEPGQTLAIKAKVFDDMDKQSKTRLCINLNSDREGYNSEEIILHANFRFDKKETVFNSKVDGEWGKEEKKKQPLKEGEEFVVRIRVHDDRYEIEVNGVDLHNYKHRAPASHIKHVFVDGPVMLSTLSWGGRYYSVPYHSGIDFPTGKRLVFSGTPAAKANRFTINLHPVTGNDKEIALHIDTRFKDKEVVRNSCHGEEWGTEEKEKEGEVPFKKGVTFDMIVVNDNNGFKVYVDDKEFFSFGHRLSAHMAALSVDGDIELHSLQVI